MKVTAFDVPPPGVGFTTLTKSRFAVRISGRRGDGAAVSVVAFTNVVTRRTADPTCTTELLMKLLPVTVNGKSGREPALNEFGEIEVIVVARDLWCSKS